ncbi:AGC family protein kinase [Tritrichomonas foetus]|uniref:AGC family protein kinase n=1 Tax=Tritrichomonas foetus TaxID=1144522 RepID=A0A1J4JEZ3_9EUKA|nr:AGC family protein kinase [Tritrichomonas foetus]|eukprot:OHS95828.1 AGC family protein kinase [Tritrichomonas foetus]
MEALPEYIAGPLQRQNILRIWLRRYAVIKGTTLIFYKDDTRSKIDITFDITPDVVINIMDLHKFTINTINGSLSCCTESTDSSMRWILAIRGCTFCTRKVTMDDFKVISVIGRGYYGKVMLCENKITGEIIAIKTVQKWKLVQSKKVQTILIERSILEQVNFPFIVSMKFAFQTDKKFYLGIEYVPGGELFNHLQKLNKLPLPEVKLYIAEIALALNYLHSKGIIYRDLKSENILIDENGHIKLTDFGLSKFAESTNTFCGTTEYLAPEMVVHRPYTEAIDWWSLGILTYELLFGVTPFYNSNRPKLYANIVHSNPTFPPGADPTAVEFIKFVLNKDPKKRPGFHEIRRSDFMKDIDFEKVLKKEVQPIFVPNLEDKYNTTNFDEEFTRETPQDSVTGLDVEQEEQYLPGFSYNDDGNVIFESDNERVFHSDDEQFDNFVKHEYETVSA